MRSASSSRPARSSSGARIVRAITTARPEFAQNLRFGYRYDAACLAALAGCGQGEDADKLTADERVRWRKQALTWLREELLARQQILDREGAKAGAQVAHQMNHWLNDPDFNGVRGPEARKQLPAEERPDWERLWRDVAELHRRAGTRRSFASFWRALGSTQS